MNVIWQRAFWVISLHTKPVTATEIFFNYMHDKIETPIACVYLQEADLHMTDEKMGPAVSLTSNNKMCSDLNLDNHRNQW